jgi:hypothetical protein
MLNFNGLYAHIRFMALRFAGEFQRDLVKYKKVKQSHYRPGVALSVPGS